MGDQEKDKRLNDILDMIGSMASLDFSKSLDVSNRNDMIDAIALGLNMLSEELNAQVVARAKLDELNDKLEQFAYTTAHDLKSPLNNQFGLLQLLEMSINPEPDSEADIFIKKLKLANQKMKNLVEGILAYSVVHSREMTLDLIDLNELLLEVIELDDIANRAEVEVIDKLPVIYFNRTAGIQVIRNLLDNAIKYSDKPVCKITISSVEHEDWHLITFKDNGPGIDQENHQKIFKLFSQVDASYKIDSVGIGLATVKRIIEAAGGEIWLESEPGKGASFMFTLSKKQVQ